MGMPELPKKLQEIAHQIGHRIESDVPNPVKFDHPDPLGADSLLTKDILDEKQDSGENSKETMKKYRLAQQVGKVQMTWAEKVQVANSISQAMKVLAARNSVLNTLAVAVVQVKFYDSKIAKHNFRLTGNFIIYYFSLSKMSPRS